MQKKLILIFIIAGSVLFACTKKQPYVGSPQTGNTATVKMSNGWWINVSIQGSPGNLFPTDVFFETYNTASNTPDSMWLDDLGNFWDFKITVPVDYSALSFATPTTGMVNQYYLDTVIINNGKVLPKAGHSRAGNITDSIYMEAKFSDDVPAYGNTYIIAGTARTGFDEDDY